MHCNITRMHDQKKYGGGASAWNPAMWFVHHDVEIGGGRRNSRPRGRCGSHQCPSGLPNNHIANISSLLDASAQGHQSKETMLIVLALLEPNLGPDIWSGLLRVPKFSRGYNCQVTMFRNIAIFQNLASTFKLCVASASLAGHPSLR